jgi:Tectonin domain
MNPSIRVKTAIMPLFIGLALATPISAQAAQSPCELHTLSVEQLQLAGIKPGGRANTIAVHPKYNNVILVTSESGGLFRSENGGKTWTHVDSLPVVYTNAVAFVNDSNFVILTASEDSSDSNRGGIWRSSDGGTTWMQIPSPSPPPWAATPPFATTKRLSAYEISVAPDTGKIYIASNYGVLVSDDPQGQNWSKPPVDPFADLVDSSYKEPVDRRVLSIVALPVTAQGCDGNQGGGNVVIAGGRAGIRRSPDGGDHWCKPTQSTDCDPDPAKNDAGCIMDMHAFGRSPAAKDQAYVVAPSYKSDQMFMQLYQTTNGGDTWAPINTETAKDQITAGGIGFVKAIKRAGSNDLIDLYVSNRISISKGVNVPPTGLSGTPNKWATFIEYPTTSEAGDTRDLAFNNKNELILAATDGGVIKPPGGWGKPLPGCATDVAVGGNGAVWVVGCSKTSGGSVLRRREKDQPDSSAWEKVSGGGVRIAAGSDGTPWLINNEGKIYRGHTDGSGTWLGWGEPLPGCARDIAVGGDGAVWVVGCDTTSGGFVIRRREKDQPDSSPWEKVGGGGVRIAAGSDGTPWLVNNEGKIYRRRADGSGPWTFAGDNNKGNVANGFNALQIYEVKGQWIGNSEHNLYFGTQDNKLWSSASSTTANVWTACCNEGGFIEAEYHVPAESDSQITFSTGFDPKGNKILKKPLFPSGPGSGAGTDPWPMPPGPASGSPKIIWKNLHVQGVDLVLDLTHGSHGMVLLNKGLAFTTDLGAKWEQYAIIGDDRPDLPRLSIPEKESPVLYQGTRIGMDPDKKIEKDGLARLVQKKNAEGASVSFPLMNNFGDFGWGPTMNINYRVFAANPRDANHLIASDTAFREMKETTNGGNDWTEIPQLTSLVTDSGKLNFLGGVFFNGWNRDHVSAQASAISFYPDDPNIVGVGTVQNGIFVSNDSGKNWKKVPGSEKAALISSLHWRKANELYVSTYGRGLWRVLFHCITSKGNVPCSSPDCFQAPAQPPRPYDHVAVAYGGRIVGGHIAGGIVTELFVEPSTTIVFGTDSQRVPNIKVTETTRPVGFQGITSMPRPPEGARVITGLTLKKRGEESELVCFQFSPRPRSMYVPEERPEEAEERPVGRTESPTAGQPYLEVLTGSVTSPASTIQLAGRNLEAGKPVEIAIDGNTVQRVTADRAGKFSTAVKAPTQFGVHSLTLIDSASRNVLDGALISVRPTDKPRSR